MLALLLLGCNARRDPGRLVVEARAAASASQGLTGTEPARADASTDSTSLDLPPEDGTSGCNLSVFGGTDRLAFNAFDARLRSAAKSDDPTAFAELVMYPLRVNRNRRSIMIRSREELAADVARIFTPSVREGLARQQGFFCRDIGLIYGAGTVWVGVVSASGGQPERYAVSTVNVPESDPTRTPSRIAPELKLKCIAPANTVLVEDVGDTLRYRSWRGAQATTSKPDLALERGTVTYDGHGPCVHAIYTFKNGNTTYELSERGCTDGSEPADTTGWLRVSRGATELAEWRCSGHGAGP